MSYILILHVFVLYSRDEEGRSPLSCAAEVGNDEIVRFLLAYQADGSSDITSPEGSGNKKVRAGM